MHMLTLSNFMAANDTSNGVERAPSLRDIGTESDAYSLRGKE